MQKDIVVSNGEITGTLYFIEGGLSPSGPLAGDGYFMALKFTDLDDDAVSVKVGLDPSQGTGLVEIINDPDKNGVFKIRDNQQVFQTVSEDASGNKTTKTYSLARLRLQDTGA